MTHVNDETKFFLACLQGAKPDFEKVVEDLGGSMTAQQAYKKLWSINKKYKDTLHGTGGSSAESSPRKTKKGAVVEGAGVKKRGRPPKKAKVVASERAGEEATQEATQEDATQEDATQEGVEGNAE